MIDFHDEYYLMVKAVPYMTLNISDKELFSIMEYVERTNLFEDVFYNNLYALVEKEKYLREKFNYNGLLYSNLSETAKDILMQKHAYVVLILLHENRYIENRLNKDPFR